MPRKTKIDPRLLKLLKRIAGNVLSLRTAKGWTQEQASEKGDFDLRFYQRVESGRYSFNLETIVRLAEVFRVDPHRLFE